MFKLNFEKTVLFVLILIILISTANIYTQYIKNTMFNEDSNLEHFDKSNLNMNSEVPTTLFKADKLYEERNYKAAAEEYGNLIANNKLASAQQKALASFKLGMCNYKLKYYDKALANFESCLQFNQNDAVSYNNSAICAFYLKDYKKAVRYQEKALEILPAVEYYYNMGRIYETIEDYSSAAKYYAGVIKGEENITYDESIDPVRIKSKLTRIMPDEKKRESIMDQILIALKIKEMREIIVINDTDPTIKSFNFDLKVTDYNGVKRIVCGYDRKLNDPYNLVKELDWLITTYGRTVYRSREDSFIYKLSSTGNYEIVLHLKFGDGSEKYVRRKILGDKLEDELVLDEHQNQNEQLCKTYVYASYEQLFDKGFKISTKGNQDRFSVVWGKDDDIETKLMDKDYVDPGALYVRNGSEDVSGLWVELSRLLTDKHLRGRTIGIRFYARKISENAKLDVRARVKAEKIFSKPAEFDLDYKWQRFGLDVYIPDNADGLTFSMNVNSGDEVKIDGFIINVIR